MGTNVADLIAALSEYPHDAVVYVSGSGPFAGSLGVGPDRDPVLWGGQIVTDGPTFPEGGE